MNGHVQAILDAVEVPSDRALEVRLTPHPNGTGTRVAVKYMQSNEDGSLALPIVYRHTERVI